ncbi:AIR synthase related protein [Sulfuracidifex metallicus]|uniref:AIR synthase related protein n=1 Tax=Sulfuracidifex metallicus TaxID=47303 RepID=UPI002276D033|nr:AIR synthase related protein [Sulfuracidifex metallicus]MCY0850859.1 AIR synthase related protein [Sulfuracidifex metallicus]
MDLEGIARKLISSHEDARKKLIEELRFYKDETYPVDKVASAIVQEVSQSLKADRFTYVKTGIKAGDSGLGSRGIGDHIIHQALFEISGRPLSSFDDAGIEDDVIVSVDGIHSRLGYFPFLAGFHATRATLRDIMVKGGKPLGVIVDIHLSDDSDIGMLTDFEAGVSTVTDFMGIKILSGSTLRIGGDMVIGERISGGIASVGKIGKKRFLRTNVSEGQYVVMTEGNGGGTIATTAIFHGMPEIVDSTLNLKDLLACKVLDRVPDKVDSVTDVTNGGIRSISSEINAGRNEGKVTLKINIAKFKALINSKVKNMLYQLNIDPLGLSIDSILFFTRFPDQIIDSLREERITADVIGTVDKYNGHDIISEDGVPLEENFRESPYTPLKKVIGNWSPYSLREIRNKVNEAVKESMRKKEETLKNLKTGNA